MYYYVAGNNFGLVPVRDSAGTDDLRLTYIYEQMKSFTGDKNRDQTADITGQNPSTDSEAFYFERLIQLIKIDGTGAAVISRELFSFISTPEASEWLNSKVFPFSIVDNGKENVVIIFFLGLNHPLIREKHYSLKLSLYEIKKNSDYEIVADYIKNKVR